MIRLPAVALLSFILLSAQSILENDGKPMRIPYECTAADIQNAGLNCSEENPCPVYLELSNVEVAGNKLFLTGNLHTPNATLYSLLLASEDVGHTWAEPHPRIPQSGLDQIQFIDFQNGWISGANLQSAPRDPFLLLTTDGGKTWRQRPIFDESRVASVERFWFDTRDNGMLIIDARLDNGRHEIYDSRTGGESWAMKQSSLNAIKLPNARTNDAPTWRLRADAGTHSFAVEKIDAGKWQKAASFLIDAGVCKE